MPARLRQNVGSFRDRERRQSRASRPDGATPIFRSSETGKTERPLSALVRTPARPLRIRGAPGACPRHLTTPSALQLSGSAGCVLSSARHREPRRMKLRSRDAQPRDSAAEVSHGFSRVPPRTTRTRIHGFTADDTGNTDPFGSAADDTDTTDSAGSAADNTNSLGLAANKHKTVRRPELPDARHRLQPIGTRLLVPHAEGSSFQC